MNRRKNMTTYRDSASMRTYVIVREFRTFPDREYICDDTHSDVVCVDEIEAENMSREACRWTAVQTAAELSEAERSFTSGSGQGMEIFTYRVDVYEEYASKRVERIAWEDIRRTKKLTAKQWKLMTAYLNAMDTISCALTEAVEAWEGLETEGIDLNDLDANFYYPFENSLGDVETYAMDYKFALLDELGVHLEDITGE